MQGLVQVSVLQFSACFRMSTQMYTGERPSHNYIYYWVQQSSFILWQPLLPSTSRVSLVLVSHTSHYDYILVLILDWTIAGPGVTINVDPFQIAQPNMFCHILPLCPICRDFLNPCNINVLSFRFVTAVYPSLDDDVITSPYNSVLAMRQLTDNADCVLPVENQVKILT